MPTPFRHVWLAFRPSQTIGHGFIASFCRFAQMRRWLIQIVDTLEVTAEQLRESRIDGIVGYIHTPALINHVVENRLPAVNLTRDEAMKHMTSILLDDVETGRMAADYLMSRGFRNFGYLGESAWPYAQQRGAGFMERLAENGHEAHCHWIDQDRVHWFKPRSLKVDDATLPENWLPQLPKPIGFFCMQDRIALDLANACQVLGIRVPEEVSILGVHNAEISCDLASPALSSIDTSVVQRGFLAATMLDQQFQSKPDAGFETVVLPPVGVVTRGSTDIVATADSEVVEAVHYIRDHAHEGIDVNSVVSALPVSRRALERKFKASLGRTLMEEIHRLRLGHALNLLATSSLPMVNVANQSGYSRQDRMAKAVRDATGVSPTTYRRKFQGATPTVGSTGPG